MKKTYKILDTCVSCGACKIVCPVHCISKGKPYTIRKKQCTGCGQCVTRCGHASIVEESSK